MSETWRSVCGKKKKISDSEAKMYEVMGQLEACLHACSDNDIQGDVNNCDVWRNCLGDGPRMNPLDW